MPVQVRGVIPDIGVMSDAEILEIMSWAGTEGWGPNEGDAEAFASADREGFLAARVDGQMVAGIAAVNWGPYYSFVGLFITDPRWRSQGIGRYLVRAALDHAGSRLIGVDGVVEQMPYYERLGMQSAHMHVRYATPADRAAAIPAPRGQTFTVVPGTAGLIPAAVTYDSQFFPGDRAEFMARWLDPHSPHRSWLAALDPDGQLVGLAAVRPVAHGHKVGPLQAQRPAIAAALLDSIVAARSGTIYLDVPDRNENAVAMVTASGMQPVFRCARMYNGPAPMIAMERNYGVCTLELG